MAGYILVVAEKKSLADSILEGLKTFVRGVAQAQADWVKIGDYVVTWSRGHAMELADPDHYDPGLKKWRAEALPWHVRWGEEQRIVQKDPQKQHRFKVIQQLLRNASTVVNAGDPDREGQLLIDEMLQAMQWRGPTLRAWLNETDARSVAKVFASLEPNEKYAQMSNAANCRALADQLLGVNLTRAMSCRLGPLVTMGRVQSPALSLVVKRDLQIEGHDAALFWTLQAQVSAARADNAVMSFIMQPDAVSARYQTKPTAIADAQTLKGKDVELQITEEPFVEKAPLPHIQRTFAKEAEALYGWTLKQSEAALQSIYEARLVSYPRTECPYLPEANAEKALDVADRLIAMGIVPEAAELRELMKPSKRIFNDAARVGEKKHGLMPTGKAIAADATDVQRKAFEIVARRYIAGLLPGCQGYRKEARFTHADRSFVCKGERTVNEASSWRVLDPVVREAHPLDQHNGALVPARVTDVTVKEGKTAPPSRYTSVELAEDMSSIAKFVSDERIRKVLKSTSGIGTDATRKEVIETLLSNGYLVERAGKRGGKTYLQSTLFGRYVVANAPAVLLDPGITALWEEELKRVERGEAEPSKFIDAIGTFVAKQVAIIATKAMDPVPEFPAKEAAKKGARKARKRTTRASAA